LLRAESSLIGDSAKNAEHYFLTVMKILVKKEYVQSMATATSAPVTGSFCLTADRITATTTHQKHNQNGGFVISALLCFGRGRLKTIGTAPGTISLATFLKVSVSTCPLIA
jgi:hypothetical protein